MHSYQHNIKTFNNATRHLTRVERSLYRDLIELYYDTEQPLPADDFDRLSRRVLANTEEEKEALRFVLDEFFTRTGDVYSHDYCDETIEKFHTSVAAKAAAGKASADARKKKSEARKKHRSSHDKQNPTSDEQTLNDSSAFVLNQKPETRNQFKEKNNKKRKLPDGFCLTPILKNRALEYWAKHNRLDLVPEDEFEKFRANHISKGTAMLDWDSAWQTWYSNAIKFNPPPRGNGYATSNQSGRPSSEVDKVRAATSSAAQQREDLSVRGGEANNPGDSLAHDG